MLLSVFIQLAFAQRYIGNVGREPAAQRSLKMAGGEKKPLTQVERERLRVIFVIFTFVVIFWATFEQAGGLMNLFAEKYARPRGRRLPRADRLVPVAEPAVHRPARHPVLDALDPARRASGKNPPSPVKMYLGLAQVALGFVCLVIAVFEMQRSRRHEVEHDLARARLLLPHDGRALHQPGRPLDGDEARAAAARLADDGRVVPREPVGNTLAGYIGAFTENMGEYAWMMSLASDFGVRPEHAGLLGVFGGLAVVLLVLQRRPVGRLRPCRRLDARRRRGPEVTRTSDDIGGLPMNAHDPAQLTVRAIVLSLILAVLLAAANAYLGPVRRDSRSRRRSPRRSSPWACCA